MTKMAATPIYGKNPLKIFSRTRRLMTLGLGPSVFHPSTFSNVFSSETAGPIELKLHMETP